MWYLNKMVTSNLTYLILGLSGGLAQRLDGGFLEVGGPQRAKKSFFGLGRKIFRAQTFFFAFFFFFFVFLFFFGVIFLFFFFFFDFFFILDFN